MRLVGRHILDEFARQYTDARSQVDILATEIMRASWHSPADVLKRYPRATIIDGENVVFDIKGNRYRLHVKVSYATEVVLVKRIGTHADYDRWEF